MPPGIHFMAWTEVRVRFGTTHYRRRLLAKMRTALQLLRDAGCQVVYLDGSFITSRRHPSDYDACWDDAGVDFGRLDRVFQDFSRGTVPQKARFGGEFYPAGVREARSGLTFFEFFQRDLDGNAKGIVAIELRTLDA